MKVLHISPFPPDNIGGVEVFCNELTQKLQSLGVYNEFLSTKTQKNDPDVKYVNGIKVNLISNYGVLWGINPIMNIFPFLIKHHNNYDIIHAHNYYYFTSAEAAIFRKFSTTPLILHVHGGVQTQQKNFSTFSEKSQVLFKHFLYDLTLGRITFANPDVVLSVSKEDLLKLNTVFKLSRKRAYWIPNGVNPDVFYPDTTKERRYITFIGRLTSIKGFDLFIKIAKEIQKKDKDARFLVIGNGNLNHLARWGQNNLKLKWIPHVNHEQIVDWYQQSRLLLLPSRSEGLPTTVLEAASCGIPVVASNVGGTSEAILNGKTGFLFEPENCEQAIEKINLCLNNDIKETAFKEGPKYMAQKFSWDVISRRVLNIYTKLLKNLFRK